MALRVEALALALRVEALAFSLALRVEALALALRVEALELALIVNNYNIMDLSWALTFNLSITDGVLLYPKRTLQPCQPVSGDAMIPIFLDFS